MVKTSLANIITRFDSYVFTAKPLNRIGWIFISKFVGTYRNRLDLGEEHGLLFVAITDIHSGEAAAKSLLIIII